MFKKCKALFAALLAVVLVFGTVTVPAAATGTTVTINGQAYTSVYELRGTTLGMCSAELRSGSLIFNNLPNTPTETVEVQIYNLNDLKDDNYDNWYESTVPITANTASISFNHLTKVTDKYIDGQEGQAALPNGEYAAFVFYVDLNNKDFWQDITALYFVKNNDFYGFHAPTYLENNQSEFNRVNHAATPENSYLYNFYRSYTASTAFISGAEKAALQQLVDLFKQELAKNNVTDDYTAVFAVHNFLAAYLYYDYNALQKELTNPGSSYAYRTVYEVLLNQRTVCEGYSKLFAAMLSLMGVPNRLVYGYAGGQGAGTNENVSNHVWNEVYLNGRWQIFDVTWDSLNEYNVNKETGKEEWTYTHNETGDQVTTEKNDGENIKNRAFNSTFADCGNDTLAEAHKTLQYVTPKNSYKQWSYNNGVPTRTQNTEDCYFVVENLPESVANGTAATAKSFGLPETVKKVTPDGKVTETKVDWLFGESYQNYFTYDPNNKNAQTFIISGAADRTAAGYKQIDIAVTVLAAAPEEVTVEKVEKNSVTLKAVLNGEYSCDGGKTWQESPVFNGLTANTSYSFCVRTAYILPSTPSAPKTVTTLKNYTPGDVNEDGAVDLKDAALIARYLAANQIATGLPAAFYAPAADYNQDGEKNLKDVVALCRSVLNPAA